MLRSFVSAASVLVLFISTLLTPGSAAASARCGEEPPKTLLSLYRESDSIHIGYFDRIEETSIIEQTEDYTAVGIKKHFSFSSTLKGAHRKLFTLEETDYRYKETEEPGESEESAERGEEGLFSPAKPGDRVVVFLRNGEDGEAVTVAHWRDGVRKVTESEMDSIEAAIRDLHAVYDPKKVDNELIVAWLVELIEDPNTRWDGAFELMQSFQTADWKAEAEADRKKRIESGEAVEEPTPAESEDGRQEEPEFDNSVYASLLTEAQKERLMAILLESELPEGKTEQAKFRDAENVLIELVRRWGDDRLAVFLAERLKTGSVEGYAVYNVMSMISEMLKDKELTALSDRYSNIYYQDDSEVVEEEARPEGEVPEAASTSEDLEAAVATAEAPQAEVAEAPSTESEAANTGNAEEPRATKTYKQLRDEVLAQFISRADIVLADRANEPEWLARYECLSIP